MSQRTLHLRRINSTARAIGKTGRRNAEDEKRAIRTDPDARLLGRAPPSLGAGRNRPCPWCDRLVAGSDRRPRLRPLPRRRDDGRPLRVLLRRDRGLARSRDPASTIPRAAAVAGPGLNHMAERQCGTCALCCELPPIEALNKPSNQLCRHAAPGAGCSIYRRRPKACRSFVCHWKLLDDLDEAWKPDRCGFYLQQPTETLLMIMVDPARPDAWRGAPFYERIKTWAGSVPATGVEIFASIGDRLIAVFPEEDLDAGGPEQGVEASMAYLRRPGWRRPAVARRNARGEVAIVALGKWGPDVPAAPVLDGGPLRKSPYVNDRNVASGGLRPS